MMRFAVIVLVACGGTIRETETSSNETKRVHLVDGEDRIRVVELGRRPEGTPEKGRGIEVEVVWKEGMHTARAKDRVRIRLIGGKVVEVEREGMRVRSAAVNGERVAIPKVWDDALATWTRMSTVVGTNEICWLGGFYSTTGEGRSFDGVLLDGGLCFGADGRWRAVAGDVVNFNLFSGRDWYSCYQQVESAKQAMFRCEVQDAPTRYVQVEGIH